MEQRCRLIVGLGNPESAYDRTRHNVGREFVDYLLEKSGNRYSKSRQAETFRLSAFFDSPLERPLVCAKLQSYMNVSGLPLKQLMDKDGIKPEEIVVVVDDMTIPFGSLRIRPQGSAGGHNGLKSIIQNLSTDNFCRIRVGVGPVPEQMDPADFVLGRFPKKEYTQLPKLFDVIKDGIQTFFQDGLQQSMFLTNKNHLEQ